LPYYSFVVLCYNNWDLSKQAITSLIESLNPSYFERGVEIIIVNNGSVDETPFGALLLERKYRDLIEMKTIHNDENLGYPVGVNCGLEQCNGEIITIVSNDLVFPENWFDGLVKTLENDRTIGTVVPCLTNSSGPQNVRVSFQSLDEMKVFAKNFMHDNKDKVNYLNRVIGACMTFRKSVIELIGGNDYWFGVGNYDDDDWSIRIRISGHKLALTGSSFVYHLGGMTYKKDRSIYNAVLAANNLKFVRKWNLPSLHVHVKEVLISNTPFQHEHHFVPIRMDQFEKPIKKPHLNSEKIKFLIVADWSYPLSEWKKKLVDFQPHNFEGAKYFFWIPSNYFDSEIYKKEISELIINKNMDVAFIEEIIYPINLLTFLLEFDVFLKIEGDYVNKYIKNLAKSISLKVI
jgi:GT2 family glycosyltransferase